MIEFLVHFFLVHEIHFFSIVKHISTSFYSSYKISNIFLTIENLPSLCMTHSIFIREAILACNGDCVCACLNIATANQLLHKFMEDTLATFNWNKTSNHAIQSTNCALESNRQKKKRVEKRRIYYSIFSLSNWFLIAFRIYSFHFTFMEPHNDSVAHVLYHAIYCIITKMELWKERVELWKRTGSNPVNDAFAYVLHDWLMGNFDPWEFL